MCAHLELVWAVREFAVLSQTVRTTQREEPVHHLFLPDFIIREGDQRIADSMLADSILASQNRWFSLGKPTIL